MLLILTTSLGGTNAVLIGPIPRYINKRCCINSDHLVDYDNTDYE
jgi:hypothetical protein